MVLFDVRTAILYLGEPQAHQKFFYISIYSNTRIVNTTLTVHDSRPRLILSGGSFCKATADDNIPGNTRGSALIEFTCDKSVFGQPRLVAQLPPGDDEIACAWVIEWTSPVRPQLKQSLILTHKLP